MNNREKVLDIITEQIRAAEMRQGCTNHSYYAEKLLDEIEPLIQADAALPESIQWAMNSGDGTYRP